MSNNLRGQRIGVFLLWDTKQRIFHRSPETDPVKENVKQGTGSCRGRRDLSETAFKAIARGYGRHAGRHGSHGNGYGHSRRVRVLCGDEVR